MAGFVRAFVLLHVVFPGESFSARGTIDIFLAGMLFAMARGVAGGCEGVGAFVFFGVRARIFLLGK